MFINVIYNFSLHMISKQYIAHTTEADNCFPVSFNSIISVKYLIDHFMYEKKQKKIFSKNMSL